MTRLNQKVTINMYIVCTNISNFVLYSIVNCQFYLTSTADLIDFETGLVFCKKIPN